MTAPLFSQFLIGLRRKVRTFRMLVYCLLAVASRTHLPAEETSADPGFNPETIMLSHFTFARPTDWKWESTRSDVSNVVQSVAFKVNYPGHEDVCRAYFNHFIPGRPAGTPKAVAKRWRETFVKAPEAAEFENTRQVGKTKISYLELSGTYKVENSKTKAVRSDFTMYGIILEDNEGSVVTRLMGPSAWVKKAKPDFKKMVEDSLGE